MLKKLSVFGLIAILIIIACIVWCFVYPEQMSGAVSVGGTVLFFGFIFGAFDK